MQRDLGQARTDLQQKDRHSKKALERLDQRDRRIRELEDKTVH